MIGHQSRPKIRQLINIGMIILISILALAAIYPLMSIFIYVIKQGAQSVNFSFFTNLPAPVGEVGGGMGNAVLGTCFLVGMASLIGVPWGVAGGIFLCEFSSSRLAKYIRLSSDILSSVPSIVIGLFVYALIVIPMKGFSTLAGSVALAIIILPTVTRATEEILKLIPSHVREAGLALGLSRWKVSLWIILRGSLGALSTVIILALARAAGETAPLLFTAATNRYWSNSLTQPIASLPVQIYTYAISPYEDWQRQAWAGAFILMVMVISFNLFVRLTLSVQGVKYGKR